MRGNTIIGRQSHRMNERGNGIYVWNAPGSVVEDNDVLRRDGIFIQHIAQECISLPVICALPCTTCIPMTARSRATSPAGNHLGFAIMFSDRVKVVNNISIKDRSHGVMLNYANSSDVAGNLSAAGPRNAPSSTTPTRT